MKLFNIFRTNPVSCMRCEHIKLKPRQVYWECHYSANDLATRFADIERRLGFPFDLWAGTCGQRARFFIERGTK
jgi:hypothetical protein